MVDAPVTCKLLSHSLSCQPPRVSAKKKQSPAGPEWATDKDVPFCQSCGFQFNVLIRRHHCRLCGGLYCRYCAQDCWPLPKFEYLHPVRVCRKCSRSCWKAEALLQASPASTIPRQNGCECRR
ncbi:hypothetical protein T484DRAFT_1614039 [Baffinella frigidus]|nr:hypothetical protein T484DRAFT_1614039 [Cryptophyta sp. CCMP2293]